MENRRAPRGSSSISGRSFDRDRNAADRQGNRRSPDTRDSGTQTRTTRGPGEGSAAGRSGNAFSGRPPARHTGGRPPGFPSARPAQGNRPHSPRGKKAPAVPRPVAITSDLQLTDGKYIGRFLQNSKMKSAVPTAASLREATFRVISRRVRAGRFLDLCAGCGTVGLEALSRGAMLVTFVERSARMASHLRKNLKEFGISESRGQVYEIEAVPFLLRCGKRKRVWDIVYLGRLDRAETAALIEMLCGGKGLATGGIAIIEHSAEDPLPQTLGVLKQWRSLEKDGNAISFFSRN